jgi:uncharacterized phiE125 gp8 family phage protein
MLVGSATLKSFLGITVTTDDTLLATCLTNAQAMADKYVDYQLEGSSFIDYMDGDGIDIIQLRNIPIKAIASIYDDIDRAYGSDTLIDSADYTFNAKTGIVSLIGLVFSKGVNNVKVTYTAGYGDSYTALPADLSQAIVYLASALYLEGKAGVQVMEAMEIVYRPSYLKKEAYKILDAYRRLTL